MGGVARIVVPTPLTAIQIIDSGVCDTKVKGFGLSWKWAEDPVPRASRPLSRERPARANGAGRMPTPQRAGRPRYVRGVIAFTFTSHTLGCLAAAHKQQKPERIRKGAGCRF